MILCICSLIIGIYVTSECSHRKELVLLLVNVAFAVVCLWLLDNLNMILLPVSNIL